MDGVASACVRRRRLKPRGGGGLAEAARGEGEASSLARDEGWEEDAAADGAKDEVLLNLLHPRASGALRRLAAVLRRLDDLSHVLAWARDAASGGDEAAAARGGGGEGAAGGGEWRLALVELPRLRLSFEARSAAGGETRLYCCEHSDLFLSRLSLSPRPSPNRPEAAAPSDATEASPPAGGSGGAAAGGEPSSAACTSQQARSAALAQLLRCVPHAVLLEDGQGDISVLVSAAARPLVSADGAAAERLPGGCLLRRNDAAWLEALPQAPPC